MGGLWAKVQKEKTPENHFTVARGYSEEYLIFITISVNQYFESIYFRNKKISLVPFLFISTTPAPFLFFLSFFFH